MEDKAFMAKSNALALAGALGDDEGGEDQKPQVAESSESKVNLIRDVSNLHIGYRSPEDG